MNKKTLFIAHAAIIAALYVVTTMISTAFGLSSGSIQVRISEALCVLVFFTPAAIPGLTIGCIIANLLSGNTIIDIIVGSLATFIGATVGWLLRKYKYTIPLPTVLSNAIIVPFLLIYGYKMNISYWILFASVGVGEVISAWLLGLILLITLLRVPYFKELAAKNKPKTLRNY